MITDLTEGTVEPPRVERRSLCRLVPARDAMPAQVSTVDGQTHDAVVGDITANGVRLIGSLPVTAGDEIRLRIHVQAQRPPFDTTAIVTSHNTTATGAHFIR